MKNYMESVGGLRKAMIADIEECLREANRSIVVKSGHISYLCYNLAFSSTMTVTVFPARAARPRASTTGEWEETRYSV